MKKEEILRLLEDDCLENEQNYVTSPTNPVNIGATEGMVHDPKNDYPWSKKRW